jgi:ADP-ribose pyrophosphatase YjhB (NUDIX family)
MAVGWGRAGSLYRPGLFTKQYFVEHGEACAADIYRAMSEEIERINKERIEIGEKPFRRPNYSSFSRYFHWFLILGLIERTDRQERAIYDFLQKRVFYRLTEKGKAEVEAWEDSVRAVHPEFG